MNLAEIGRGQGKVSGKKKQMNHTRAHVHTHTHTHTLFKWFGSLSNSIGKRTLQDKGHHK